MRAFQIIQIAAGLLAILLPGCIKEEKPLVQSTPTVVTATVIQHPITDITQINVTCGGEVTADGGAIVTSRGVCWSTSHLPTTEDSVLLAGKGSGKFTVDLLHLEPFTKYYVRAWATNAKGTAYGDTLSFFTETPDLSEPCPGMPTITDIDGNVYKTVLIDDQCWMKENLRTTRYADHSIIPLINSDQGWINLGANGARTWMNDDSATYATLYGALYNWHAVTYPGGLCPQGWHVPSDQEWKEMELFLGMPVQHIDWNGGRGTVQGGMLKSTGTQYWWTPNKAATNFSGFTALPAGARASTNGKFWDLGKRGSYWTATGGIPQTAWARDLDYSYGSIIRWERNTGIGYSVRCVRDL
jgi:uncharacterized protein (TIGR02145 family)